MHTQVHTHTHPQHKCKLNTLNTHLPLITATFWQYVHGLHCKRTEDSYTVWTGLMHIMRHLALSTIARPAHPLILSDTVPNPVVILLHASSCICHTWPGMCGTGGQLLTQMSMLHSNPCSCCMTRRRVCNQHNNMPSRTAKRV